MSSDYGKVETDVELKASATQFHEFFTKRPHHLTNVSSETIKDCNLHEGEWGTVGSIINWSFVHDGKTKVIKDLIEAVDDENNSITMKVLEGDLLEHYKSFKFIFQATPKGEGCSVHCTLEYEKVHGDVEDPHTLLELVALVCKDICSHLST